CPESATHLPVCVALATVRGGEELVCLDSTGRPFKVVDGPVQNGCLGEAYPGGTAVPFPEESGDTRINVSGNQASLYFECHDIGDYDLPTRFIAPDTFLAGTGISSPLKTGSTQWALRQLCEQPALDRTPSRKSSRLTLGTES